MKLNWKLGFLLIPLLTALACGITPKIAPTSNSPDPVNVYVTPLFRVVPFDYHIRDTGDGWNEGLLGLASVNVSGKMLDSLSDYRLSVGSITINTREGQTYTGELIEIPGNPSRFNPYGIDINRSDVLPMPNGLVFATNRGNFVVPGYDDPMQGAQYWLRFRFAYAAHPTSVEVSFSPSESIENATPIWKADLMKISPTPPVYEPQNIRPFSELRNILSFNDEGKIKFDLATECTIKYDSGKQGWNLEVAYTALNQDSFNQQLKTLSFGYATWFPYGAWDPQWQELTFNLGPAQSEEGIFKIALWYLYQEPLPIYFILYEPIGTYGTYDKVSVFSLQCLEQ